MTEDLIQFSTLEAMGKYTSIKDNTEKMNDKKLSYYFEDLLKEIVKDNPQYFEKETTSEEIIKGLSSILTTKLKIRLQL